MKNGSGTSLEDAEKAFELFKEDAEKAFELFKADAEKAAELMMEDVKEEHAKQLAEALDKLYEDIEARVKEDWKGSKEFAAFSEAVKAMRSVIGTDDEALLEEVEALRKENEILKANNGDLSRKEIISGLVEGFNEEHKSTMVEFLEGAKTEEEIYERFNAIASIIEGEASTASSAPKKDKFKRK